MVFEHWATAQSRDAIEPQIPVLGKSRAKRWIEARIGVVFQFQQSETRHDFIVSYRT